MEPHDFIVLVDVFVKLDPCLCISFHLMAYLLHEEGGNDGTQREDVHADGVEENLQLLVNLG